MSKLLPHLGRIGQLPCECGGVGVCVVCEVRAAADHLEKVYHDDTKRAQAVHALVAAVKKAAQKP